MAEQTCSTRTRVKLASLIVGGSAVVAMGALTVTLGANPQVSSAFVSGPMQTGSTVTEAPPSTSTPDSVLETSLAVPPVKSPPYGKK